MTDGSSREFVLSASHLGPIFSLSAELTKSPQALIFARNGMGKSFLCRAIRYLDLHKQDRDISDAAKALVSDESPDHRGAFSVKRGEQVIGTLSLDKSTDSVIPWVSEDTIFHVFSSDFVFEELIERSYEINDSVENRILVSSENVKVEEARGELEKAYNEEQTARNAIVALFNESKNLELVKKASIHKNLKEYRDLKIENQIDQVTEKPDISSLELSDTLKNLANLKEIPTEPVYPEPVSLDTLHIVDEQRLSESLQKISFPSRVPELLKRRIESHHSFYKEGTTLFRSAEGTSCPFCLQDIISSESMSTIESYIEYFSAEEEKHQVELRHFDTELDKSLLQIDDITILIDRQTTRYDALKHFIPSQRDSEIHNCENELNRLRSTIQSLKKLINKKAQDLCTTYQLNGENLFEEITKLDEVINDNNTKSASLMSALMRVDDERKKLQRDACSKFVNEFIFNNWQHIKELKNLQQLVVERKDALTKHQNSGHSMDARVRVAETFESLLEEFFGQKYVFDKESFLLKRGDYKMTRGPQRTLSDGEKNAIAFCYFVACVHRKVKAESDYKNILLVVDDPVTSMSYDYIFTIAQILKYLSISEKGIVSVNPNFSGDDTFSRPEFLVLTHSSYFFNVSKTNYVVKPNATWALYAEQSEHKISEMGTYLAPFQQHLKDIFDIAIGTRKPDHTTGNSIRSVLEAVGRFCRPDKVKSLSEFVTFLAREDEFKFKSLLLHSVSHGSYFEEAPPPDDLRMACEETIKVVEKYAVGQLEVVKSNTHTNDN